MEIARVSFTDEQLRSIERAMRKKNITQRGLSKELGISQPSVAHFFAGKMTLRGDLVKRLYETLDKDPEIEFLESYTIPELGSTTLTDRGWNLLYRGYAEQLKVVYDQQPSSEKANIINDLEKIVQRYKQQPEGR